MAEAVMEQIGGIRAKGLFRVRNGNSEEVFVVIPKVRRGSLDSGAKALDGAERVRGKCSPKLSFSDTFSFLIHLHQLFRIDHFLLPIISALPRIVGFCKIM
jgi:hypothetical protein